MTPVLQEIPSIVDNPTDATWDFVDQAIYDLWTTPIVVEDSVVAAPRKTVKPSISLAKQLLASGDTFVQADGNRSAAYLFAKRCFDVFGAIALLIVFSPIMLATLIALMITTRGKPIFQQVRLGYQGLPFTMYKFRTMSLDATDRQHEVKNEKDGPIFKNRNDPRITQLGQFLRKTSVDEMPQLFNVLAGHMSLVGPRPPIGAEVAKYAAWQRRRLSVKPGLTCLWQISGRSEISFENWVRMDLWYVKNQNFVTDLALLLKTPWSVLCQRGAC